MAPQKLANLGLLICLIACSVLQAAGNGWHSWQTNVALPSLDHRLNGEIFNNLVDVFKTKFQGFAHDGTVGDAFNCSAKLQDLILFKNSEESIAFVDAAGKPGPGLTSGNFFMLGSYDMCQSESLRNSSDYQNCKVSATLNLGGYPMAMTWTGCMPGECQGKGDMVGIFEELAGFINTNAKGIITTDSKTWTMICDVKQKFDAGAYAAITLLSIIGFLVVVGTLWFLFEPIVLSIKERKKDDTEVLVETAENPCELDQSADNQHQIQNTNPLQKYETTNQPDSLLGRFLKCFALQRTFEILTSTTTKPGMVLCLNGVRVLSINWVVLGHTYFMTRGFTGDIGYTTKLLQRRNFMLVYNGLPSVDSFFAMSGFLVSYLLLKQLAKRNGLTPIQWVTFYVHRYMRLTIPYLMVILVEGFLYRLSVSGPLAQTSTSPSHEACKKYWYSNLLYTNNLYPWKAADGCIGQAWYLANDMQFFVIAPIFIVFLFRKPLLGLLGTVGTVLCSAIAAAVITAYYKLGPASIADQNKDDFWLLYNKPWVRVTPYLVGILGGWVYWKWGELITQGVKTLPEWLKVVTAAPIWLVTAAIQYAVVFGLYNDIQDMDFHQKNPSEIDSVSYQSLARIAWSLSLTIQVLLCQCGLGGFINSILSWSGWQFLGRLTYSVYLLHFGLLTVIGSQTRHAFSLHPDFELAVYYLGILAISYLAAAVLYLCVEQPVALLEGITYRKDTSK